ncbi:VIT1/CCC1 transporter family protein [Candidatus Woesearchaeota archaeon]|nr:VIT1/CCC1 transporter family protein [Candidatus Woesearchaeota archaeon]
MNVLGLVLGVASATSNTKIILVAGLASTFAESISMAAVAYTSSKAANEYYLSEVDREKREIKTTPKKEKAEIKQIYYKKGFRGKELNLIVNKITSSKKLWLNTMIKEEMRLSPEEYNHPVKIGAIVGFASIIGSFIPLFPFFVVPVNIAMWFALATCLLVLFITGAVKAKLTIGDWKRSGFEMAMIGTLAALAGYGIGRILGAAPL